MEILKFLFNGYQFQYKMHVYYTNPYQKFIHDVCSLANKPKMIYDFLGPFQQYGTAFFLSSLKYSLGNM